ncbi:MAG TPA: DUF6286 domain-containing protein [Pseudonocardia sp.]|jgi:hypothetical protein
MRVLLRVLSPLLGLVVAAVGAVLAVEVVAAWIAGDDPGYRGLLVPWVAWRDVLALAAWRSVGVLVGAAVLAVLGLLLLFVAATARRRDVRLTEPASNISVNASPRVLARLVGQRVRSGEQIVAATVTASGRVVKVRAVGKGDRGRELRTGVLDQVLALLNELPLSRIPRVSVSVRPERGPR